MWCAVSFVCFYFFFSSFHYKSMQCARTLQTEIFSPANNLLSPSFQQHGHSLAHFECYVTILMEQYLLFVILQKLYLRQCHSRFLFTLSHFSPHRDLAERKRRRKIKNVFYLLFFAHFLSRSRSPLLCRFPSVASRAHAIFTVLKLR